MLRGAGLQAAFTVVRAVPFQAVLPTHQAAPRPTVTGVHQELLNGSIDSHRAWRDVVIKLSTAQRRHQDCELTTGAACLSQPLHPPARGLYPLPLAHARRLVVRRQREGFRPASNPPREHRSGVADPRRAQPPGRGSRAGRDRLLEEIMSLVQREACLRQWVPVVLLVFYPWRVQTLSMLANHVIGQESLV